MLAQDWSKTPDEVVEDLTEAAVAVARDVAREREAKHLRVDGEEE